MEISQQFSWPTALKHAGLVALTSFGLGTFLGFLDKLGDPERAGALFGRFLLPTLAIAVVTSFAMQTSRKAGFYFCAALTVIFLLLPPFLVLARRPPPVMRADEIQDFQTVGWNLCQPALGISFRDPGSQFVADPEGQLGQLEQLKQMKAVGHAWVWREGFLGGAIVVHLIKMRTSDSSFRSFAEGMRGSAVRSGSDIEDEKLEAPYRYLLSFKTAQHLEGDILCLAAPPSAKDEGVACLMTFGPHSSLSELRASFSFGSCG